MARQVSEVSLPTRPRESEQRGQRTQHERFIVAIDYGTTCTSVAYACVPREQMPIRQTPIIVNAIEKWPGGKGGTSELPTETTYCRDARHEVKLEWGFRAHARARQIGFPNRGSCHFISLAKLLLHSSTETDVETENIRNYAAQIPRTGPELIGEFLKCLFDYLFRRDRSNRGHFWEIEPELMTDFSLEDIEFVIGVPAAWTEQEQLNMIAAAGRAGFINASRVSEPEAVATQILFEDASRGQLKHGKTYVICDAGGGTVDYVTFTILSLEPLHIKERCVSEGVLCGSTYLNKRFRNLLKRRLNGIESVNDQAIEGAVREFDDDCKLNFDGDESGPDYPFMIQGLPNDAEQNFADNYIQFSVKELRKEVFDHIFDQIIAKLQRQIDESRRLAEVYDDEPELQIDEILLAGGLSQNEYLKMRIRDQIQTPVRVARRNNAIVASGLVHRVCMHNLVKQRRSRVSYGVRTHQPYEPEMHGDEFEAGAEYDSDAEETYVDLIECFLAKDSAIIEGHEITARTRVQYRPADGLRITDFIVWHDSIDMSSGLFLWSNRPPDLTIKKFTVSLRDYPLSRFEELPHKRGKPRMIKVNYEIVLRIDGPSLVWSIRIMFKDGGFEEKSINTDLQAETTQHRSIGSIAERQQAFGHRMPLSDGQLEDSSRRKRAYTDRIDTDRNEEGGRSVRPRASANYPDGAPGPSRGVAPRTPPRAQRWSPQAAGGSHEEDANQPHTPSTRRSQTVEGAVPSIEDDTASNYSDVLTEGQRRMVRQPGRLPARRPRTPRTNPRPVSGRSIYDVWPTTP